MVVENDQMLLRNEIIPREGVLILNAFYDDRRIAVTEELVTDTETWSCSLSTKSMLKTFPSAPIEFVL